MIRKSEKRRLVGAEAPVTRAAIHNGSSQIENRSSVYSNHTIACTLVGPFITATVAGTRETDVEPFDEVATSKRLPSKDRGSSNRLVC